MSEIEVKLRQIRNVIDGEADLFEQIKEIQEDVYYAGNHLGFTGTYKYNIKKRLQNTANEIYEESHNMKNMKEGLERVTDLYEATERRICGTTKDGKVTLKEQMNSLYERGVVFIGTISPASCIIDLINGEGEITFSKGKIKIKGEDIKDDLEKKINLKKKSSLKGYFDKDGWHKINSDDKDEKEKFKSEQIDKVVTIAKVEASKEIALVNESGLRESELGSLSGEIKLLDVEAHANAYAGLYSIGPDGEKRFSPGVGCEVGTSVTAFTANGLALLGNDDLGVYVKGEVTAGKAEAKAGLDIGLTDAEGKFNPQIAVNASAEAIAVEAEAALGGKILGADISGNVGVNVGIGAHANVGFKEGKISLDIGASIGLGVSANLEIDISGTVDRVTTAVSDAVSALQDVGEALNETAEAVGNFTSDAVRGIKKLFKW